jgi:hypothetical protein
MNENADMKPGEAPPVRGALLGRTRAEVAATAATFVAIGAALYFACRTLDGWASAAFAQPILASALVAVCDVVLVLLAISLAPAVSACFWLPLRRFDRAPRHGEVRGDGPAT